MNLQNILYVLVISIILIILFVWWKNYTQKKWNLNKKYLKNIPTLDHSNYKEKMARLTRSWDVNTISIGKRNNFNIFKIIIRNNSEETEDIEIFYKEEIPPIYSTGIFGFAAMQSKK